MEKVQLCNKTIFFLLQCILKKKILSRIGVEPFPHLQTFLLKIILFWCLPYPLPHASPRLWSPTSPIASQPVSKGSLVFINSQFEYKTVLCLGLNWNDIIFMIHLFQAYASTLEPIINMEDSYIHLVSI